MSRHLLKRCILYNDLCVYTLSLLGAFVSGFFDLIARDLILLRGAEIETVRRFSAGWRCQHLSDIIIIICVTLSKRFTQRSERIMPTILSRIILIYITTYQCYLCRNDIPEDFVWYSHVPITVLKIIAEIREE